MSVCDLFCMFLVDQYCRVLRPNPRGVHLKLEVSCQVWHFVVITLYGNHRKHIGAHQGCDGVWNYGIEHVTLFFLNAVGCIMHELPTVTMNYFCLPWWATWLRHNMINGCDFFYSESALTSCGNIIKQSSDESFFNSLEYKVSRYLLQCSSNLIRGVRKYFLERNCLWKEQRIKLH